MSGRLRRAGQLAAAGVLVVAAAVTTSGAAGAGPAGAVAAGQQAAIANPDAALGAGWRSSTDLLATGIGDTTGFHIYVAHENAAFRWSTLATLVGDANGGVWTGYTCVTGSGNYVAAVYAPAALDNKADLVTRAASAAIVDLHTGQVRHVVAGVALAYFDPACGTGDQVVFSRFDNPDRRDLETTDLYTVDAAAGTLLATQHVKAELTTPAPAADGVYGIARGDLVRVNKNGGLTKVATPTGTPVTVQATNNGIDLLTVGDGKAFALHYAGGRLTRLGDAPEHRLQLFGQAGDRDVLVGDTSRIAPAAGMLTAHSDQQVEAVSEQGHLLVRQMLTRQVAGSVRAGGAPARGQDAGAMSVVVRTTHDGRETSAPVTTTTPVAPAEAPAIQVTPDADGPPDPPECAVPRNDIHDQALQPSPNQVEWAVDQAVQGTLTVQRPANYLDTGQAAYTPQGMFGTPSMSVPAQVLLGIVAQESNVDEATWHAVPGDGGNPLVADYYGNQDDDIDSINWDASDCGYGVAQITDGMSRDGAVLYNSAQQTAIATDYAANIAAALQILIGKWNQLQAVQTTANNNDPAKIENWWFAVWGYNSGVYANDGTHSNYGIGWLNNPANPIYEPGRDLFLRNCDPSASSPSCDDASTPGNWSYEEKVMGWIETPQWTWNLDGSTTAKYSKPIFGDGHQIDNPSQTVFCLPTNNCDPSVPDSQDPCPAENSSCWFHGNASWAPVNCAGAHCTTAFPIYSSGTPEPALQRDYPLDCKPFPSTGGTAYVVDDLNNSSDNVFGCSGPARQGKFLLSLAWPPADGWVHDDADPPGHNETGNEWFAPIDLHQLGAGYYGHMWFTHTYEPYTSGQTLHEVIGTWVPNLPAGSHSYEIWAHLPSHGAVSSANYLIYTSNGQSWDPPNCAIDQGVVSGTDDPDQLGEDVWVSLGHYTLSPGASVQLTNMVNGADGSTDIAYDAMAFVSTSSSPDTCGSATVPG